MSKSAYKILLGIAAIVLTMAMLSVADEIKTDTVKIITPPAVENLYIYDKPNDPGGALMLEWTMPSAYDTSATVDGFKIYEAENPTGAFELVITLPRGASHYERAGLTNGRRYYYKITTVADSIESRPFLGEPAIPKGQWFNTERVPILILVLLFTGTAIAFITRAKGGYSFYVRPIAGIKAVDEAIGRATEMGRPILYVPGLGTAADVATIAAFTILARVARKVVEYNTKVIVPNYDPVVMAVCQEVVKEAYSSAGKPEMYNPKDVYFITQDQFPYTAAVNGVMVRERPATNFYMGMFYAESLVLAETGFISGSIQIAGTDQLTQIPFFVSVCDFVLMGEELYAASAYLSQEPQQLGTLKAQDWGKVLVVVLIILGVVFSTIGWHAFAAWFNVG